ncbi:MAG: VTT domain-containing protein [Kiritimatiellia bacterium]
MKKFLLLFFGLSLFILATFLLFGESFDFLFDPEKANAYFLEIRHLAGPAGAGFLISDLFLPVPTTVVIGAMGAVIGVTQAAIWGWLGLTLAGLLGYGLARWGGKRWADKLVPPPEQHHYRDLFNTWGGLAVVLSRMLPILPEVLSVLAGLYGMSAKRFILAVSLGSIPPALLYAWIGSKARDHPGPALWSLVAVTAVLWGLYVWFDKKKSSPSP